MLEKYYPYEEDLPISKLRVDVKNPRIPEQQDSQIESFHLMAKVQEEKLIALAKHIIQYGLNPAEKFIVIPDDEDQYIVLDGNRRLTTLRILETPEIVQGHLKADYSRQLKRLSEKYLKDPLMDVPCLIFQDREQADPWIELIHDGESGGAGLVKWSAQQRSRFQSRKGKKALHLQALDFVIENGELEPETKTKLDLGKYPASTLQRVIGTPYVRDKLGIASVDGELRTHFPKKELLKGLTKLVDDIGTGRKKVDDFMTQKKRIDYINALTPDELPDPIFFSDELIALADAPENGTFDSENDREKKSDRSHSSRRKKLIPSNLHLNITEVRLNDIYIELKRRLIIEEHTNAIAVLIRAFLEMSVDGYIERNNITINGKDTLQNKIMATSDYMENNNILKKNDLKPIRRAASKETDASSATSLHGYVHNRRIRPLQDDLRATWDTLQIFFEKIW